MICNRAGERMRIHYASMAIKYVRSQPTLLGQRTAKNSCLGETTTSTILGWGIKNMTRQFATQENNLLLKKILSNLDNNSIHKRKQHNIITAPNA